MRSGQMLENKKQLLVHCEPWPFWPWMDEWHYCFAGDELILAGKKILVKTNWFSLPELSKNGRVIRFKISALHREPPWHFPSFAVAAWYLQCVLLRLAAAIAALTEVSVKRARGLPDRDGVLAGAEVRHMDTQHGTEWWRLLPWWSKCSVFGCPWGVMWLGEQQTWSKWCVSHQSPLPHTNPPPTFQNHFFIFQNMIRIYFQIKTLFW